MCFRVYFLRFRSNQCLRGFRAQAFGHDVFCLFGFGVEGGGRLGSWNLLLGGRDSGLLGEVQTLPRQQPGAVDLQGLCHQHMLVWLDVDRIRVCPMSVER